MPINNIWPSVREIKCVAGAKFSLSCIYQKVTDLTSYSDLVYDRQTSVAALSGSVSVLSGPPATLTTRTLDTTSHGGKTLVWAVTATEDSGPVTVRQIQVKIYKPGDEYYKENEDEDNEMTVRAGWTSAIDIKFLGVNKVTSGSVAVYYKKNDITSGVASGSTSQTNNTLITPILNTTNYGGKTLVVVATATLDADTIWIKQIKLRVLKPGEET